MDAKELYRYGHELGRCSRTGGEDKCDLLKALSMMDIERIRTAEKLRPRSIFNQGVHDATNK